MILGWIWIYKEILDFYRIKVQIQDRFFYIACQPPHPPYNYCLADLLRKGIYENRSSAREQWKNKEGLIKKDYVEISRNEYLRIIFMGAPLEERKVRNEVLRSLGEHNKEIQVDLSIYKNQFDIKIEPYTRISFYGRSLPRRNFRKRIKNMVGWMRRSVEVKNYGNYNCYSAVTRFLPLPDFLWFLEDEGKEDHIKRILEDIE
jgi:hypothetical protein